MSHPYPIREIARRAGVSKATVDRVLNHRGAVRPSTAAAVARAIADLDTERSRLRFKGQTVRIDVVVHTPGRSSAAIKAVLDREAPTLRPADIRVRFVYHEPDGVADLVAVLDGVHGRGPRGVILIAPDSREIVQAVDRLRDAHIPVVTLVSDLPLSRRTAHVGVDNRAAGTTAAYLIEQWLGDAPGDVLIALGPGALRDHEEREAGFRSTLRNRCGQRALVEAVGTGGHDQIHDSVTRTLHAKPGIAAVYSVGGPNRAILNAFQSAGRRCRVFIGHDLDHENLALIRDEQISAVLDHDLHHDLRRAFHIILSEHDTTDDITHPLPSTIHIVTPFNIPTPHAA